MYILIITIIILICIYIFINCYMKKASNIAKNTLNNTVNNIDTFKLMENTNKIDYIIQEEKPIDNIKMMIFIATWCGACNAYKKNVHNDLSKELQEEYKNIQFEFIVDDPKNEKIANLQKYYEIKYFPTIILYKNDKYKKLAMNEPITKANIVKLVDSI